MSNFYKNVEYSLLIHYGETNLPAQSERKRICNSGHRQATVCKSFVWSYASPLLQKEAYQMYQLLTVASATRFDLFEEIITLVVYQDECREVFYFNLPDSFHTQFRIFYTFNALDIVLSQDGSRTTDRT